MKKRFFLKPRSFCLKVLQNYITVWSNCLVINQITLLQTQINTSAGSGAPNNLVKTHYKKVSTSTLKLLKFQKRQNLKILIASTSRWQIGQSLSSILSSNQHQSTLLALQAAALFLIAKWHFHCYGTTTLKHVKSQGTTQLVALSKVQTTVQNQVAAPSLSLTALISIGLWKLAYEFNL